MKIFLKGKNQVSGAALTLLCMSLLLFFSIVVCVSECKAGDPVLLSGKTMGTTWHITISVNKKTLPDELEKMIVRRLDDINAGMSLFLRASELSAFNRLKKKNARICVSDDFMAVCRLGGHLYELTEGAWDGTIGPLVNLWGFGNKKTEILVPDKKAIKERLGYTGFSSIKLLDKNCLVKEKPELVLDFGSLAKGFAVDAIALLLRKNQIHHFLVEIGGEVYASGMKNTKKWRIGIKSPDLSFASGAIYTVVDLENMALATSGDYRNFHEIDGVLYSHIIDPETGWPVKNKLASVSVMADNTAFADGLATALMVMGEADGLKLVNSLDNVESLIIVRNSDGSLIAHTSSGWKAELPKEQ